MISANTARARGRVRTWCSTRDATPYSGLAMADLGERAGIAKGVFSVLTGSSAGSAAE